MPWQLILSAVPVILLLIALVRYEIKMTARKKKKEKQEKEVLMPVVEKIQQKHREKYGRPNTELEREFRAISEAK